MQLPKPVAFGLLAIALIALAAALWFTYGGQRGGVNQSGVPEHAYPKSGSGPDIESIGGQPLYTGSGPAEALPLEGQGGGGGRR